MRIRLLAALSVSLLLAGGACAKSSSTPTPTVTGVVVSGGGAFTARNDTSQLMAMANVSDSTTQNVSGTATWSSSNSAVATVTSTGLVTAVANGSSSISAAYQGSTGSLAVIVTLHATATVTGNFQRLCGPFRGKIDITLAETGRSVGFNISELTVRFRDLGGNVRASRTYSAADLTTALGSNHIDANATRILTFESTYSPVVDTEDSTASISMTLIDDVGNTQTINVGPISQHDRC